jgi:hypothetical protein
VSTSSTHLKDVTSSVLADAKDELAGFQLCAVPLQRLAHVFAAMTHASHTRSDASQALTEERVAT